MKLRKVQYFKLFWILLFLGASVTPLLHIDALQVSKQENRALAKFPAFTKGSILNENYAKEFEAWLGDHFWGRKNLLSLHQKHQYINKVVCNKEAVFFQDTGWMFNFLPAYKKLSSKSVSNTIKKIKDFNVFCQKNGIKLYLLIVPFKQDVYFEEFRGLVNVDHFDEYIDSFIPFKKELGHMFVFPYNELRTASRDDFVFFKESHHWTEYGAYIGYLSLLEAIQQDFHNVKPIFLDRDYTQIKNKKIRDDWARDFNTGQTANLLLFDPKYVEKNILKTDYIYYNPKGEIVPDMVDTSGYKIKHFKNKNPDAKYKVFLSGYSQNENLLQFLPYSFSEIKYYRLNNVKGVKSADVFRFLTRYKKDLLEYKPDILILTINSRYLFMDTLWHVE